MARRKKVMQTEELTPLLVTVETAAEMLSIARSTLYELLYTGAIQSVKIGTARRIEVRELHAFIQRSASPY